MTTRFASLGDQLCGGCAPTPESRGIDRYSVDVLGDRASQRRWPDLVEGLPDRRKRAIEVELAVKHTRRLEAIIWAYRYSDTFADVLWLVENPALLRRLEQLIRDSSMCTAAGAAMRVSRYPTA